jgi:vacuolar-type H+-ATPase subunit F/Vma7
MSADSKFRTPGGDTRMLFLGDAALTDGFRLIGFETWADPDIEQLDQLLGELLESRSNAFLILDSRLSGVGSKLLEQVRNESGRILITLVPPLNDPDGFHCAIDQRVNSMLDNGSLENPG